MSPTDENRDGGRVIRAAVKDSVVAAQSDIGIQPADLHFQHLRDSHFSFTSPRHGSSRISLHARLGRCQHHLRRTGDVLAQLS